MGPTASVVDSVRRRKIFPTQGIELRFVGCSGYGLFTTILTELYRSLLKSYKYLKL
jgi:hypothetical protein